MTKPTSSTSNQKTRLTPFQKLSLSFFNHPRISAVIFLTIMAFGIVSYTTLLKREGFPSISVPFSLASGTYIVNDPAKVDHDISKPLSDIIIKQPGVKRVDSDSNANFYTIAIEYKEGTDAIAASNRVERAVKAAHVLPAKATTKFEPLSIGVNERGDDMLLAFYSTSSNTNTQELYKQAQKFADALKKTGDLALAQRVEAIDPYVHGIDSVTGQASSSQKTFDRFSINLGNNSPVSHQAITIGIKGAKGFDVLELDKQVRLAINKAGSSPEFKSDRVDVSYSAAPDINDQINGLQHSLLDALAAVLVISAILIALRASLLTVSAMVIVLLTTLGILYLIHYSLNTITLFSLILCLSLIVDDTIIMVEAIDAQRRKSKSPQDVIKKATKKISRAMIAATLTATIGFAPLIFVSGILGSFIRAIPITVITSLLVSLVVALTFIPFLSRYLLLRPKQLGHEEDGESPAHHIETFVARTISRPILWTNHHRRRQFGLGIAALIVGFGFIIAGGLLFSKVTFNIFPPDKDSDFLSVTLNFAPNSTIEQSQQTAKRADNLVSRVLGKNLKQDSYYGSGNAQTATLSVNLLSFKKRSITAPQLVDQLDQAFKGFQGASVKVGATGVGPNDSAFSVLIESDKRANSFSAAQDLARFLRTKELTRLDGTKAHFKSVTVSNPDVYSRDNSHPYVKVSAEFDGTDTSALVTLAQNAIKETYNDKKMAQFGLKAAAIVFDTGAQGDFQNSFKKLAFAFPLLLVAIYLLLATQFRSLLQPLLIFMAIPFSFFGITAGLWLTHNAFSFFTLLGFFALLGLSIKNTILLTDYANQARRNGSNAVEAVAISLQERFRPLVATSVAAIISLIPLYLSNPFWEGLTVTLMFGLLSSTFLVITVFPYYYLGAEYLRLKIRRRAFGLWLLLSVAFSGVLIAAKLPKLIPVVLLLTMVIVPLYFKFIQQRWLK